MNARRSIAPDRRSIVIAGCGSYLPARRVTNDEVEQLSGFDRKAKGRSLDDWARLHHGGEARFWADDDEATSDLALMAAGRALDDARMEPSDLDLIVLSTFTSDHPMPSTASRVQAGLRCQAKFLQIDAACSGFIDAMWVATSLMRQHGYRSALVVAGDILSRLSAPDAFLPRTVFGDGAGAVVLTWHDDDEVGTGHFSTGSEGDRADLVLVPAGGSRRPLNAQRLDEGEHYWQLQFGDIRSWALERLSHCTTDVIRRTGLQDCDIAWLVPHQASTTIIRDLAERLQFPMDRVVLTYPDTGNTSGASIPIALDHAKRAGRFRHGDWLVLTAVGAGMAWGAMTYRWADTSAGAVRRSRVS